MPPDLSVSRPAEAWSRHVPAVWRAPLVQLALGEAALAMLTRGEWAEMAWQWWNSSTCNHILLIPPIVAWLVRLRWPELAKLRPQAWWPALAWLALGLLAWAVGSAAGVNLVAQAGTVMLAQAAVALILGPRVAAGLLFPLGYLFFLVPFGDEIVPPLQQLTARMAVALTQLSGVPATLTGVFIDTPVGRFEVASACSGVKFLVAMVALGTLVAHLSFRSRWRRAGLIAACAVVPVLANGVRAWGTIYVAQSRGIAFAAGFDHIVYGWIFFAIVMALILSVASRFYDRPADDRLVDAAALAASPRLARWAQHRIGGWAGVIAISTLALAASSMAAPARPLAEGLLAAVGLRP